MTDLTNYSETEIRDWMTQGVAVDAAPSNIYVALHTAAPGDDAATGEVSAGDYSRVSTAAGTDWGTPTSDSFENANEIAFSEATSLWGDVSHVSLWDASTGGNALAVMALDTTKTIDSGDQATFAAGDLSFSLD